MDALPFTDSFPLDLSPLDGTVLALQVLVGLLGGLVGTAIVLHVRRARAKKRKQQLEARWAPRLDAILAGTAPFSALDDLVASDEDEAVLAFLQQHVQEAPPADRECIQRVAYPFFTLVPPPLAARRAEQRAYRLHRLSQLNGPNVDATLRAALHDASPFTAMVALRALIRRDKMGLRADEPPLPPLVMGSLPRFKDWRQASLAALIAQVEGIARPLRRQLANDAAATWVRVLAARSLQHLADRAAAPIAVTLLQRDTDLPLQTASLRLLEAVGDRSHVPLLRQLCGSDNEVIRIRALSTLAHVGAADAVPYLEQALDDPSRWVARQGALGLLRLGHPNILHTLAESSHPRAALARQVLTHHRRAA